MNPDSSGNDSIWQYHNDALHIESSDLASLAERFGTPLFVYSRAAIESTWRSIDTALGGIPHLVCYAVKANSNLAVLNVMARLGSGFDIVSVGELERVLAAGGDPAKIVFSGVGKRSDEMARALEVGIRAFNIESQSEIERLAEVAAAHGVIAPVSLRINPDVDAKTHPYISTGLKENKFGIAAEEALDAFQRAASLPSLAVHGIDCHIGSQLTDVAPYQDAMKRLLELVDELADRGIMLSSIDMGGGQGIRYRNEQTLNFSDWATEVRALLGNRPLQLLVEPGRYVVGNAGVLLTRIEYLKHNTDTNFCIVDAAMNDLIRPALYSAWQEIVPLQRRDTPAVRYDVVGPVCESADFLGKSRMLAVEQGDYLAVGSAGAYAFVMSSNYNSRPRAAEVMIDRGQARLVRSRETLSTLFQHETLLPE